MCGSPGEGCVISRVICIFCISDGCRKSLHLSCVCVCDYQNFIFKHLYINWIKPWTSNTFVWCEHICQYPGETLICFLGICFPTVYFQKYMLIHRVRYQNFIRIWWNIKSRGITLLVYTIPLQMRNLTYFCNITQRFSSPVLFSVLSSFPFTSFFCPVL